MGDEPRRRTKGRGKREERRTGDRLNMCSASERVTPSTSTSAKGIGAKAH
jgi:hypothetical protein